MVTYIVGRLTWLTREPDTSSFTAWFWRTTCHMVASQIHSPHGLLTALATVVTGRS